MIRAFTPANVIILTKMFRMFVSYTTDDTAYLMVRLIFLWRFTDEVTGRAIVFNILGVENEGDEDTEIDDTTT